MFLKKLIVFGLFLLFISPTYAYKITDKEIEQTQQKEENQNEQTFCHYDMGDWYGFSKYDEKTDKIIITNCTWGMGFDCITHNIPKLAEFENIKIYYNDKYPENIFINDNGNWKWKNAGCDEI